MKKFRMEKKAGSDDLHGRGIQWPASKGSKVERKIGQQQTVIREGKKEGCVDKWERV